MSHTCLTSCLTFEWVMSHTWMSRVFHLNELCLTYEWVVSFIWTSHVSCLRELIKEISRNHPSSSPDTPYCNTLQHAATHCNTLHRTATHCDTLQHIASQYTATHCSMQHISSLVAEILLRVAECVAVVSIGRAGGMHMRCSMLQHVAASATTCCRVLQQGVSRKSKVIHIGCACSSLQSVAVCCSVLQCVAVCCSVLQEGVSATHTSSFSSTGPFFPRSPPRGLLKMQARGSMLQGVAVCCSILQYDALCCNREHWDDLPKGIR